MILPHTPAPPLSLLPVIPEVSVNNITYFIMHGNPPGTRGQVPNQHKWNAKHFKVNKGGNDHILVVGDCARGREG